jgi:hypothetical protein
MCEPIETKQMRLFIFTFHLAYAMPSLFISLCPTSAATAAKEGVSEAICTLRDVVNCKREA